MSISPTIIEVSTDSSPASPSLSTEETGLPLDVVGIIGSYLDVQQIRQKAHLYEQVDAILTTTTMAEIFNCSPVEVLKDVCMYQKEDSRIKYDSTALNIAEIANSALLGDIENMARLLSFEDIRQFDLSDQTYPWEQPRYIALSRAVEAACRENQIEALQYLLGHHLYTDLANAPVIEMRLTRPQRFHRDNPRTKQINQQNFKSQYTRATAVEILKEAAKLCSEMGYVDCLKELFAIDAERGFLQNSIFELFSICEKHGHEDCKEVVVSRMDISDRD